MTEIISSSALLRAFRELIIAIARGLSVSEINFLAPL